MCGLFYWLSLKMEHLCFGIPFCKVSLVVDKSDLKLEIHTHSPLLLKRTLNMPVSRVFSFIVILSIPLLFFLLLMVSIPNKYLAFAAFVLLQQILCLCCRILLGKFASGEQRTEWGTGEITWTDTSLGVPDSLGRLISVKLSSKTRMMTDHLHTGQPSRLGCQPGFISSCQKPKRRWSSFNLSWTTVLITQTTFSISPWLGA